MTYTVSITSQGQLTIPKAIRKHFGLNTPKKVFVEERAKEIVIKPVPDFFSLYQSIKPKKKVNWKEVDKAIPDAWVADEVKNLKLIKK